MRPRFAGGDPRLPAMKVSELLELEQLVGAFIIIETLAVVDSAAAQAASLAADATILVIDTQVAKVPETREAVGVLRQPGVVLLGAVLAPVRDEEDNPDGGDLDEESNADGSDLDEESNADGSDLDEGNGRQPRSSGWRRGRSLPGRPRRPAQNGRGRRLRLGRPILRSRAEASPTMSPNRLKTPPGMARRADGLRRAKDERVPHEILLAVRARPTGGSAPRRNGGISQSEWSA